MKHQLPKEFESTEEEDKSLRKFYNKARTIINALKYLALGVAMGLAVIILNRIWEWIR